MNIKIKKALNDLRIHPGRTTLVILALVTGLWGVGSMLVSYTILTHDLNENFIGTSPPHAVLRSKDFNRLDLAAFRARPEVESAEFRDFSFQRIEVRPDVWIPLWLFGVEDFDNFRLARFYAQKGARKPGPGAMVIERDGQLISDLKVGSPARVRSGARKLEIPVAGVVFDPAQAPATQDHFIYGYADKATYANITGEQVDQRLIFRLKNVKTTQDVIKETDRIINDLASADITIRTREVPPLNEHPHQWQLNTLLFLQGSISFLAFFMAAVLVSQLMDAILTRQVREIGTLKALGASRGAVFVIYGSMILMFAVTAGVIAVPLAISSGRAFARFVSTKINFDILMTGLPLRLYVYFALIALVMPFLLSLPALFRGIRIPVYDALADYGIKQPAKSAGTASAIGRDLPNSLVLAFRNALRRKKRLAVTVLTMALGVAIFSTGFNVRQSLALLLADVRNGMRHDVQVVLRDQIPKERALSWFRSLENVARIEAWNGGRGEMQSKVIATNDGVGIVALPWDTDLFRLRVVEGRWLKLSGEPEVVMNQQAMEIYQRPPVGGYQMLMIGGKELKVRLVGVVEEFEKPKIYLDRDIYDGVANPEHNVNSLMFVAKDNSYGKVMALKKEIEKAIVPSDLNVLYVMSQAERTRIIYDHLNIILTSIVFVSLLVLVVSAMGMASATGISILERTREIGVMRAIGATPKTIFALFTAEGMITSVAGILLGLLLSWPLSLVASRFFGSLMLEEGSTLRLAFSTSGFLITMAVTLAFGWLASRIPAQRAVSVSTREALAYE
jgi:putative ABC transport system permease protein